jgi:hypothetical protein
MGLEKLTQISTGLKKGQMPDPNITTRKLLDWFGAQRRGVHVNRQIREALEEAQLETIPDFERAYIDGQIEFAIAADQNHGPPPVRETTIDQLYSPDQLSADPTFRVGQLPSANTVPVSVNPNQRIREVITIMLANDFSQLPVMTGERDVKGVISWTSIRSDWPLAVFRAKAKCATFWKGRRWQTLMSRYLMR